MKDIIGEACKSEKDPDAWAEAAEMLLSHLEERERREGAGESHMVRRHGYMPDSIISNYAYRLLQQCHFGDCAPPRELVALFQRLLGQHVGPRGRGNPRRERARLKAIQFFKENPSASNRAIAKYSGVDHTTVGRWRKKGLLDDKEE